MSSADYKEARELGQKEYRACVSSGRNPYLLVLDTILLFVETQEEESLGLVDIPIDRIVGTKTAGRTNAFAANFMPLLDEDSEFAGKWANLVDSHIEEGIHDPITAYEFMNKFFVVEGNKRVSVMKYFNAAAIPGSVKRIIPKPQNTEKSRIYFDFLDFYKLTGVNFIWFSRPGKFKSLLGVLNDETHVWSEEERTDFSAAYYRFRKIFKASGGDRLPGTTGDAFLAYLTIYDINNIYSESDTALRKKIEKIWSELAVCSIPEPIELDLDPNGKNAQGLFSKILPPKRTETLNVLYVSEKSPETSAWAYAHDEGHKKADLYFNGKVSSRFAANVSPELFESVIEEELSMGTDVVFATSSELLPACLKAAVKYPDVKFLNCSVYSPHPSLRNYNGRTYEVKFLEGIIAGAMTRTHKIGYIADYPIYGEPAAINAFARGTRMTDPYAQVFLKWRLQNNKNVHDDIISCGVDIISGSDLAGKDLPKNYGLYKIDNDAYKHVFDWQIDWGEFYIRILGEIMDRTWKDRLDKENPKAVNYWWGLSANVFEINYTSEIPPDTLRLVSLLREDIVSGKVAFFDKEDLSPEKIIMMDTLAENVIGTVPDFSELTEDAKKLARIQGMRPEFREGKI